MQHETNTFSPLPTNLEDFASIVGLESPPSQVLAREKYGSAEFAFSAMIDEAEAHGAEISIPIAAYAEPSGKVSASAFDHIADAICADVRQGCDAVLLDLHGAMVTTMSFDGEGELLKRIRAVDADVPIGVALDFHTNLTTYMVDNATVIDGYRTYPHIDMYETGQRVARSIFTIMQSGKKVKTCWKTMPMMTHMILQTPARQPMKDIMDGAISAVDDGDVLNASVFGGFPLADIPHVSFSALTVEYAESENGQTLVEFLCAEGWRRRRDFVYAPEPLEESVKKAGLLSSFPVVIADHGDNCGAGGSADDLTVLGEMIAQGLDGIVAGPIWDPKAVAQMIEAGEGAEITVNAGGKTDVPEINQEGHSLTVKGRVSKVTNGRFVITGPMQTGLEVNLGPTAVLKNDQMELVLCSERWEPYDPGCFTHAGIDPLSKKYIMVKSRQHFRAGFEPLAQHIILAAGPGVCSSDYSQFGFKNLMRPIYPLDTEFESAPDG
jgi:microcystin degradation protein MlrC